MLKTCYNCCHYHGCLSEANPSQYHIHDYCDKFNMALKQDMESEVNHFLDDHWNTLNKAVHFCDYGVFDDFETGDAFCWMFEETSRQTESDEWYKENKAHNRELAIKTLEYMFEKDEVWDEFDDTTWYKLTDYFDEDEIKYLKDLLNRLKGEK